MLPQGILKAHLSPKLLGHADMKLTLGIYSHFLPSMGDYAANARESLGQTRCATVAVNWPRHCVGIFFHLLDLPANRDISRDPASGLEPLTCSLRVCCSPSRCDQKAY